MPNINFAEEFKREALKVTPMQKNKNGKGQTGKVTYNGEEGVFFQGPACRTPFEIKPGFGDHELTEWVKMNMVMELDPDNAQQHALIKKLEELGDAVCDGVFKQKEKVSPKEYTHCNRFLLCEYDP